MRYKTLKNDSFYLIDWEVFGTEEKHIGRELDFIEYVNFYLKSEGKKEAKNIHEAIRLFEKNYGGSEPGEGIEIIIRNEIY